MHDTQLFLILPDSSFWASVAVDERLSALMFSLFFVIGSSAVRIGGAAVPGDTEGRSALTWRKADNRTAKSRLDKCKEHSKITKAKSMFSKTVFFDKERDAMLKTKSIHICKKPGNAKYTSKRVDAHTHNNTSTQFKHKM